MMPQVSTAGLLQRLRPEQLEHELNLARQVQRSLYPTTLPNLPGVSLAAVNHPARIVSGDLYDVIRLDPERIAIVCADVSGKGFPAALLAAEVHAYVRSTLRAACVFADTSLGPLPVQVVSLLNTEFARQAQSGRYATMFFAEFDASGRALRYVTAGHNPPLLFTPGGSFAELTTGGPPIGLFEDSAYDPGTLVLPEHAILLIYTDGVVEARNVDDEEFGLDRLVEVCMRSRDGAGPLLTAVMQAVRDWSGEVEQGDDITLLALGVGSSAASFDAGEAPMESPPQAPQRIREALGDPPNG
jgi:sigma-B regulation protein RsbU (phosphoserine phosphatase)